MKDSETIEHEYPMRHKNRLMSTKEARALLERADYGVLSTTDVEARTYGTPLNFCVIDESICFHVALDGRKIDNFATTHEASFCIVERAEILPEHFTCVFESVIAEGPLSEAFDEEKHIILTGLVEKYSPAYRKEGGPHIERYLAACRTFRMRIARISGKRKV